MAFTYEFIDNTNSVTVKWNGIQDTFSKTSSRLVIPDDGDDDELIISTYGGNAAKITIRFPQDTILGVGAGSTTATQLRDALQAIFFLVDGGGGGGITSVNGDTGPAVTLSSDDIPSDFSLGNSNVTQDLQSLGESMTTGWVTAPTIVIDGGGLTFSITGAGTWCYIDKSSRPFNPQILTVPIQNNIPINLGIGREVNLYVDNLGNITQEPDDVDGLNTLDRVYMGNFTLDAGSTQALFYVPQYPTAYSQTDLFVIFMYVIGGVGIEVPLYSPASTDLTMARGSGKIIRQGIELSLSTQLPDVDNVAALNPVPTLRIRYVDENASLNFYADQAGLDPDFYYNKGTQAITAVPNNDWTIQRMYLFASEPTNTETNMLLLGNAVFNTEAEAIAAYRSSAEDFVKPQSLRKAVHCGAWIVQEGTTDLNNATFLPYAFPFEISGSSAGFITTSDLQTVYQNSVAGTAEIITNAVQGALTMRAYNGGDVANMLEVLNFAGTTTYGVTGNGDVTANSFSGDGSGLTNLPTTETFTFSWDDIEEAAPISFNDVISVGSFTSANAAGKQIPPTATIKEVRITLSGPSSAAASGNVIVQLQRRESGDALAYTAGAGTSVEVATYTIGGALGPLYDRSQRTTGLSTAVGGTNPVLYAYLSSIGFATLESVIVDVVIEY